MPTMSELLSEAKTPPTSGVFLFLNEHVSPYSVLGSL
jgi:hypothetical protein